MGDDRPAAYQDGPLTIYRASSLGSCTKLLAGLRQGCEAAPVPPKTQETFQRGHDFELIVLDRLRDMGHVITGEQQEFDLPITKTIVVRCHVDGLAVNTSMSQPLATDWVLEVKSQSQEEWDRFEREGWDGGWFPKYKWQTSVEMLATGRPLLLARINRESHTTPVEVSYVLEPWFTVAQIRARVLEVEKWVGRGTLPSECDHPAFPCPLYRLHPEEEVPETATTVAPIELDSLARDYNYASSEAKHWLTEQARFRDQLRLAVVGDKVRTTSGILVSFNKTIRRRLDEKALAKDVGPLDKWMVESETETIRVTMPKTPRIQ